MSLTKIGSEHWDFVDAEGCETRLPEAGDPAVSLPTRWRVFGPLEMQPHTTPERLAAAEIATAAVKRHTTIPDTLKIGNKTLEAQDVDLDGDTLDLDKDFGAYETVSFQGMTGRECQQPMPLRSSNWSRRRRCPSAPVRASGCNVGLTTHRSATHWKTGTKHTRRAARTMPSATLSLRGQEPPGRVADQRTDKLDPEGQCAYGPGRDAGIRDLLGPLVVPTGYRRDTAAAMLARSPSQNAGRGVGGR